MNRSTNEIIGILNEFTPFSENDLENDNVDFLYQLTDELLMNSDANLAIRPMFELVEKFPNQDFGSPGPIVHFIEKFRGLYETELFKSLQRIPTLLTIWMLNRLINSEKDETIRDNLLIKMKEILVHQKAGELEKEEATNFLDYQLKN